MWSARYSLHFTVPARRVRIAACYKLLKIIVLYQSCCHACLDIYRIPNTRIFIYSLTDTQTENILSTANYEEEFVVPQKILIQELHPEDLIYESSKYLDHPSKFGRFPKSMICSTRFCLNIFFYSIFILLILVLQPSIINIPVNFGTNSAAYGIPIPNMSWIRLAFIYIWCSIRMPLSCHKILRYLCCLKVSNGRS